MIRSNITEARIPPVMTTVPAVIRIALHQHPAKRKRREGGEERKRQGVVVGGKSWSIEEGTG